MKAKHLITCTALLLPVGMAHAQPAGSPEPAAPAPGASAGSEAGTAKAAPATDADLAKGKVVNDPAGQPVGTIDSMTASGVVLTVGEKKIQIPKDAIGKNDAGLVIAMTRAEIEAAAKPSSS